MKKLTSPERYRYARHLSLSKVGEKGQTVLKNSRILIVGAGGLGSPAALYLAAAGVGTIGLVDYDTVDETNLQRQILYSTEMVGKKKTEMAKERLTQLNPFIDIHTFDLELNAKNIEKIVADYQIIIDGSDNFKTRYLLNDYCCFLKRPLISGAIHSFEGQLSVFNYQGGPCYRCLYPKALPEELAPNCTAAGVLGILPGMLGILQATEALKILLNLGSISSGVLICFDALGTTIERLVVTKDQTCQICSKEITKINLERVHLEEFPDGQEISLDEFLEIQNSCLLIDIRDSYEREISLIEGSIHIPLSRLEKNHNLVKSDSPIVLYCQSGVRSKKAVQLLQEKNIFCSSLKGGMMEFQNKVVKF